MKVIGTIFFSCLISLCAIAQTNCGSQDLHEYQMSHDAEYARNFNERQSLLAEVQRNGLQTRGLYTIPIVVHIFHLGEPVGVGSNISDAQIHEAVQGLNDRFANVPGFGVDMEVQFCLATRDPNGCSTDGINRVDASSMPGYITHGIDYPDGFECGGTSDPELKALSTWPVLEYYNIWVVHTICEGWGGYAYFPWGDSVDGTVILDSEMNGWSHVLAHELGHGFNLAHTFNGDWGGICPADSDCLMEGDYVCDTPPHRVSDCGDTNPCTPDGVWTNSRYNIMSYCWPLDRFTQGQKERVLASLLYYPRADLLNSQGCTPSDFNTGFEIQHPSCFGDCNGSVSAFHGCPGTYQYMWNTGEEMSALSGLCPGDYSLTVTDEYGHEYSFVQTINETEALVLETGEEYSICAGESIQLNVEGATYYEWWPQDGLSDPYSANPLAAPVSTTAYSITGLSDEGCVGSANLTVNVLEYPEAEIVDGNGGLTALPSGMTYQWYLNGEIIEGATGDFIEITEFGLYQVEVTNGDICSDLSEEYMMVGNQELPNDAGIYLFPNPSQGVFSIHVPEHTTGAELFIYDAAGRLVYSQVLLSKGMNDVRCNLAQGIYPVVIRAGEIVSTQRLLVVK